jgi:hypothetical protein
MFFRSLDTSFYTISVLISENCEIEVDVNSDFITNIKLRDKIKLRVILYRVLSATAFCICESLLEDVGDRIM